MCSHVSVDITKFLQIETLNNWHYTLIHFSNNFASLLYCHMTNVINALKTYLNCLLLMYDISKRFCYHSTYCRWQIHFQCFQKPLNCVYDLRKLIYINCMYSERYVPFTQSMVSTNEGTFILLSLSVTWIQH